MPEAITMGELLIDFVSTTTDVSLSEAPGFHKAPGGAPANVAVGLARLGVNSGFIGKVGSDPFGVYLKGVLEQAGVDTSRLLLSSEARTTLAFVATRSDGRKDITFYRNPGADILLRPEELDEGYIRSAKLFHFGSVSLSHEPSRSATLKAANTAKEAGLFVSYDPNVRLMLWDDKDEALHWIWQAMPLAEVAKLAEEEWEFVVGTNDLEEGAKKILNAGPKLVVVTRGENGCYYDDGRSRGYVPAFQVDVVDPLGAGDGFVAAMLLLLKDEDLSAGIPQQRLEYIMRFANAAGALTTQKVGVIPALPTREEIERFMQSRG